MQDLVVPNYTKDAQRRAANPRASAWVSANAGAGKTKVLTDRVVRLLLAGSAPDRILCLTFTKAAAANMAIRVFERLGRWVTLDEEELSAELTELEGRRPSREELRLARRLFARAVETPGGLKIDTIHAFCERLLHLVPFEANIPARFAVLDDSKTEELLEESTANVLADAASGFFPDLAEALRIVSMNAAGDILSTALKAALSCKSFLHDTDAKGATTLRAALGLANDDEPASIQREMLEGGLPPEQWLATAAALDTGKITDQKRGASLRAAWNASDSEGRLDQYLSVFFTDGGTARMPPQFVTQAVDPALKDLMLGEQLRLGHLLDKRKAARAAERTHALFTLAREIGKRVERTKMRLGALDFQDLIDKTLALLSQGDASWVLYKLDRGIDHVLIDEAQDTNPEQWEILRRITEDFTSGQGARERRIRTLFAVGDPKQSIYGFQGAAPQEFETTRKSWSRKVLDAKLHFEDVSLTMSFRSAKAVLSAVDATFAIPHHFKGLSFDDSVVGTVHESARPHAPGLVELWPTETPTDEEEPEAWTLPLDRPEEHAPPVRTARRVARAVKSWITQGDETGHTRKAGDILVLVRKRGPAFEAVIRALKEAGVPVAGADRINIGEHIAVLDLVAAGQSALLPDDDLTLATALKSPLVGLDDDDLIRIAAYRDEAESLLMALERYAIEGDEPARRGLKAFHAWRELARMHGPFGFFTTLLGPLDGRRQLVSRLGSEASDAIDAFLCFAHQFEQVETPSLTAFLNRFKSAAHTIKRDLDSTNDEVRVMTVHGAKGLEAPVVILIDGCDVLGRDPVLFQIGTRSGAALPVWSPGAKHDPGPVGQARALFQAKALAEHNRLLYVAMTRAKDRLVIAPYFTGRKEAPQTAWCEMIRHGLVEKTGGLETREMPYGSVEIWQDGAVTGHKASASEVSRHDPVPIPDWLVQPAAPEPDDPPLIRPSGIRSTFDRDGHRNLTTREARLRGTLVHTLLERLPQLAPDDREGLARAYIKACAPRLSAELQAIIVEDALKVIDHEALGPLFGPQSRAEVPIAGQVATVSGTVAVSGQIDRLVIRDKDVLLADFKTGARPRRDGEPLPASYGAQLALYRTLLQDLYPDRPVKAFVVWTSGPIVRELTELELQAGLSLAGAA